MFNKDVEQEQISTKAMEMKSSNLQYGQTKYYDDDSVARNRSPLSEFDDDDFLLSSRPGNRQRKYWKRIRAWIPKYWRPRIDIVIECALYMTTNLFYMLSLRQHRALQK